MNALVEAIRVCAKRDWTLNVTFSERVWCARINGHGKTVHAFAKVESVSAWSHNDALARALDVALQHAERECVSPETLVADAAQ